MFLEKKIHSKSGEGPLDNITERFANLRYRAIKKNNTFHFHLSEFFMTIYLS